MSDWELVQENKEIKPKTDWELVPIEPNSRQAQKETLGLAVSKAPFRIGEDILRSGYGALTNLPNRLKQAKTEIPGAFETAIQHPGSAGKQILAGLAEQGQKVFNLPHDLANYAANRLNLVPKNINEKIQMARMPSDTQEMINQTFGQPHYPGEELLRGLGRNSLATLGIGKAASTLNPMNLSTSSIVKDVLNTRKQNKKEYSGHYKNLWNKAEKEGYGLGNANNLIDIDTIKKYTPSKKISAVEDFINNPNLKNAHLAKSDLLKVKDKLESQTSLNGAERKQYKAVTDAINNIQKNMFKNSEGKTSNKLLDRYNKIQHGYANEVVPYNINAINKYTKNKITDNELLNALSKGEFYAKRGKYHNALRLRNLLGNHPYITGAGLGGGGLYLYNDLMGNRQNEQQ